MTYTSHHIEYFKCLKQFICQLYFNKAKRRKKKKEYRDKIQN